MKYKIAYTHKRRDTGESFSNGRRHELLEPCETGLRSDWVLRGCGRPCGYTPNFASKFIEHMIRWNGNPHGGQVGLKFFTKPAFKEIPGYSRTVETMIVLMPLFNYSVGTRSFQNIRRIFCAGTCAYGKYCSIPFVLLCLLSLEARQ